MKIPFNQSLILDDHIDFLKEATESGKISSGGKFSLACEDQLDEMTQSKNLLVPSATAALEMMALLLNLEKGDEVIVPSFTFVSSASAFSLRGVKIRFADNDSYGNILPSEIERLCTPKTKAVCVVHYGGNSADMSKVQEICRNKKVALLEDAAQCIHSFYKGKPLGTLGEMGCFSFHDTKNLTSGEGGSLIVNNETYLDRAYIIRDKGTNRKAFLDGQVDKYSWVDLGSSYCLSELNSSFLYPQLQKVEKITDKRKVLWQRYFDSLKNHFERNDISIITPPEHNTPNFHMFAVLTKNTEQRKDLIKKLVDHGIQASFHYVPLHLSKFGKQYCDEALPNCEDFSSRILRFPLWYNMSDDQITYVCDVTKKALK